MRSHILVHGYFSAPFWLPSLLKESHSHSLPVSLWASMAYSHPPGSRPAYMHRFSPNPWFLPFFWVPYKCHPICDVFLDHQNILSLLLSSAPSPTLDWLCVSLWPDPHLVFCLLVCCLCLPRKTSVLCGWALAGFTVFPRPQAVLTWVGMKWILVE